MPDVSSPTESARGRSGAELVSDARKIAVLRATALGDFVFALPALDALRAAYPQAEIVLLARRWHRDFLAGRPSPVDRVIALPEGIPPDSPTTVSEAERQSALRALADEGFDIGIQLHGGGRNSNPIVRALRAGVTAGCRTPDAPLLDRWIPYAYYQAEVFRNLEVVRLVGAHPVAIEPSFRATDADREAARRVAPSLRRAGGERPLVVLHPGASDARRRWPATSFGAIGDRLAAAGALVVVTGTRSETALVAEVLGSMREEAVGLAGRLDLAALTGLLSTARLIVSNDTGPLHLANALGTPSVGIYWCGNVINAGPPFRERSRIAISWRLTCPVCGIDCTRGTCSHRVSFVADVPVGEVSAAALDLLGLAGPAATHGDPAAEPATRVRPRTMVRGGGRPEALARS